MRRLIVFTLLFLAASALDAGETIYRIVSQDESGVKVEFNIPSPEINGRFEKGGVRYSLVHLSHFALEEKEGMPVLPVKRFVFRIPSSDQPKLELINVKEVDLGVTAVPLFERGGGFTTGRVDDAFDIARGASFVRLSGTGVMRKQHVCFVDLYPVLFDSSKGIYVYASDVEIMLHFNGRGGPSVESDAFVSDLVVNDLNEAVAASRRENAVNRAREPFEFALSNNWVKVSVKEPGVYCITYDDLYNSGIDPSQVDPSTLRLFSNAPLPQPDSITNGGSFRDDYHMEPISIMVKSSVGSFMPGDSLIFYALGVNNWSDYIDPSSTKKEYLRHPYSNENVYWLTWGGSFGGVPHRMTDRQLSYSGNYDITVDSYTARVHIERDILYDSEHADNRWYWRYLNPGGGTTFIDGVTLSDVKSPNGLLRTIAYGPYKFSHLSNSAQFFLNNSNVGSTSWTVSYQYNPGAMKIFEGKVSNLVNGTNYFKVVKPEDNAMYIQWYELFYERMLKASGGRLDFFGPDTAAVAHFELSGFGSDDVLLFDVTDYREPVVLRGFRRSADSLLYNDTLTGSSVHYYAVSRSSLMKPSISYRSVQSLRDNPVCPDMLIIYNRRFKDAALELKSYREGHLAGVADPVVKAVDIEDVYDNFSGGLKDPVAIRNYLKFLYDHFSLAGSPVLKYVLLVGQGTHDQRDILHRGNDLVPLYMNIYYSGEKEAVEDEDFFTKLDDGIDHIQDVAIGRLAVLTEHEANAWVDRIIDYEEHPEYGSWKDKIVIVADDEYSSNRDDDFIFMLDAEELSSRSGPFPTCADIKKVYLHAYPFVGGVKPDAKRDLIKEWSDGAVIVNYSGHGSPLQMADERVMTNSDIYSLTNGARRPIYLAFSCSIGNLDSPYQRSMAENMVNFDGGGAIGTICAAAPTYGYPNSVLNSEFYYTLFMSKDSTGTLPIGLALQLAKVKVVSSSGFEQNNAKYILLGDPSMVLAFPGVVTRHQTGGSDTLSTGYKYEVNGAVTMFGDVDEGFNGNADVIVQEAPNNITENLERDGINYTISYSLPGNVLFRGTSDVLHGLFNVSFVVPKRCRTGFGARIRSYVSTDGMDGAGAVDTLVIRESQGVPPNSGPPKINMHFAGMATKVKSGAMLIADIFDDDGIAIIGSEPQNSIFLDFDDSGFPIFITDYFTYDHGSYTKGTIKYPLSSGIEPGRHSVVLKAFDNLGISSTDTLDFEIVSDSLYQVTDVFNFPNPFSKGTNFVFQLSDPADIVLDVYNVSGFLIWHKTMLGLEGFNSIFWDGRDLAGDIIANGTYIYQLDVRFRRSFHREEKVRGKVVFLK